MASYWKSQPKKFCEICKCWLGDNKASIEFHERGKSHQEKKKKQFDLIRKNGMQQAKINAKADEYLKKMEIAARKQYMQDLKEQGINVNEEEYLRREQATKAAVPTKETSVSSISNTAVPNPITITKPAFKRPASSETKPSTVKYDAKQPFGKWSVVETASQSTEQLFNVAKCEPVLLNFTEKTVNSGTLSSDAKEPVAFKKRKVNNRSIRSKTDKD